jgi:hypothetical protein
MKKILRNIISKSADAAEIKKAYQNAFNIILIKILRQIGRRKIQISR